MNCSACGAAMRLEPYQERLVCDFCGGIYFPEEDADGIRVLGEPADTRCPLCDIPLVHAAAGGLRVLHCTRCRGLLIPMERFVAIIQNLRARREQTPQPMPPPDPLQLERSIACPSCGRPMDTHPYAGPGNIIIDNCPDCSLNWLDHGELRRIVMAAEGQRSRDELEEVPPEPSPAVTGFRRRRPRRPSPQASE